MIKINEHLDKINEIKKHIQNSKNQQRKQYLKCLHKLQKELKVCNYYLGGTNEYK